MKVVKYVIKEWPYTQELMEYDDFYDHACLINDAGWIDQYGDASYFVEEEWLKEIGKC